MGRRRSSATMEPRWVRVGGPIVAHPVPVKAMASKFRCEIWEEEEAVSRDKRRSRYTAMEP